MNRSYYFVIDGIDGSGKTTQLGKVANYLTERGVSFISTKEPGGTEIGNILRDILISKKYDLEPETELLLYSADRIEHQKKMVIPNLDKGITVLSDRFISS
ncbi:MAG: dTMP kinase, partial [Deferribacterales bacterium]